MPQICFLRLCVPGSCFQCIDINYAIGSVEGIVSGEVETLETSSVACYQILQCRTHSQSLWQIAPEKTDSSNHQKQTTKPPHTHRRGAHMTYT